MTAEAEPNAKGEWMTLSPDPDITAYDLWRCMMLGQNVHPEEAAGIPADLLRHYKQRPVGQY